MQFLRLNSIALAVAFTQAAVLPRQEGSSSSLASLPNTSATSKAYLTSITTLPMPTSVEGNTAYPPSTTSAEIPAPAQTSAFSTPYTSAFSASTSQSPFNWNANATSSSNMTASPANATTSMGSSFATGLSASTANVTVAGVNSTIASVSAASTGFASSTNNSTTALVSATNAVMNGTEPASETQSTYSEATATDNSALRSEAPYANSTTSGLIGGVAATGTAVIVTGVSAANATQATSVLPGNTTLPALIGSTSSIVQLYLSLPTSLRAARATRTPKPSSSRAPVALFGANTTAPGVAAATGINVPSTILSSNTTMATVVSKPTAAASRNATSSSTTALSTGSSSNKSPSPSLVANAVDNNGTMFAVTYDDKNGTIIQLIPANSTNPLAATGTNAPFSTASASANLGRRGEPISTTAPIEPAAAPKGSSWNTLTYASTESLPRPSRFFSGEGWLLRRRIFWA